MNEKRNLCVGIVVAFFIAIFISWGTSLDFSSKSNKKSTLSLLETNSSRKKHQVGVSEKEKTSKVISFNKDKIRKKKEEVEKENKYLKVEEVRDIRGKLIAIKEYRENNIVEVKFTNGDREVITYKNDKPNGKATYYFVNGDIESYFYKDGVIHGEAEYTYSNGKVERYRYNLGNRVEN